MTETGLLIAQVVFLVLLYLFVWSVVRSSSRQVGAPQQPPPMVAPAEPPARRPAPAEMAVAGRAPERAAPPAAPVAAESPTPTAETRRPEAEALPTADQPLSPDGDSQATQVGARAPREGPARLDLASNVSPRLVVASSPDSDLATDREIDLEGGVTIGRSRAAELSISDQFVSHMHARILRRGPYYFVEDLGSTNGTFLNDRRVERDAQLKVRDTLRIGQTVLRYEE